MANQKKTSEPQGSKTDMRIVSLLRALLFPPRCVGCGELLEAFADPSAIFCPLCRTSWETVLTEAAENASEDAARGLVYLTFYRSGHTEGIPERLIYHLKHKGDPRSFDFVAARLAPRVLQAAETLPTREIPPDADDSLLFTYPPRRPSAVREDGFDQAKRMAQALARACGGEFAPLIRRTRRRGKAQKELDAEGRAKNANSAYEIEEAAAEIVSHRIVVICDDVCTTGATLNRCAELLIGAGAALVILCTVAKTHTG